MKHARKKKILPLITIITLLGVIVISDYQVRALNDVLINNAEQEILRLRDHVDVLLFDDGAWRTSKKDYLDKLPDNASSSDVFFGTTTVTYDPFGARGFDSDILHTIERIPGAATLKKALWTFKIAQIIAFVGLLAWIFSLIEYWFVRRED